LTGCSSDGSYNFKTSSDAVETYHQYLTSVQTSEVEYRRFLQRNLSLEEVNDTVIHFLMKDSTLLKDHNVAAQLSIIHDSVRNEMLRLSETWRSAMMMF
jgi:hypothetical protein